MIQPDSETQLLLDGPRRTEQDADVTAPLRGSAVARAVQAGDRTAGRPGSGPRRVGPGGPHRGTTPLHAVPRQVGRYELVHRLGHGGMATVHLGRATGSAGFEKKVAIKIIHPHLADEPELVGMFLDEARLVAGIHHPNVVETLDLGEADGVYYAVMEFVEGDTLSALVRALRPDRLPVPVVLQVISDVCEGLAAAHDLRDEHGVSRGLVHRDISPQNLLVTLDGWVKISDFGIAKAAGKSHNTRPGELRGKLSYMSPEQARGEAVDHRTDIFALGIVCWELLAGERLFRGDTDAAILDRVVRCQVPPVQELRGDSLRAVPEEVFAGIARLLERSLAARPQDRYASAREMAAEVRALLRACEDRVEPRRWLSELMRERFASRAEYLRAVLRETGGHTPIPPDAQGSDAAIEGDEDASWSGAVRRRSGPSARFPALTTTAAHTVPEGIAARARRVGLWLLLPLTGAAVGVFAMSRAGDPGAEPASAPEAELAAVAAATGTAKAPVEVQWYFSTEPDGAVVFVDGERHAEPTPTRIKVPRGSEPVEVRIEKAGYRPAVAKLAPVADQSIPYRLEPVAELGPAQTPEEETDAPPRRKDPRRLILRPSDERRVKGKTRGQRDEKADPEEELMPMPDFGGGQP